MQKTNQLVIAKYLKNKNGSCPFFMHVNKKMNFRYTICKYPGMFGTHSPTMFFPASVLSLNKSDVKYYCARLYETKWFH